MCCNVTNKTATLIRSAVVIEYSLSPQGLLSHKTSGITIVILREDVGFGKGLKTKLMPFFIH